MWEGWGHTFYIDNIFLSGDDDLFFYVVWDRQIRLLCVKLSRWDQGHIFQFEGGRYAFLLMGFDDEGYFHYNPLGPRYLTTDIEADAGIQLTDEERDAVFQIVWK